ncbi:hypothetical protein CLF_108184, partial [Clonorchis sinensis]
HTEVPPLKDPDLIAKPTSAHSSYGSSKAVLDQEQRRVHNAAVRHQLLSLDAYDRHRKLVNDYLQYYGGSWSDFKRDDATDRRDIDVIREHGRFLWSDKDEPKNWSERLAKRYWDKLFKEYCLVDLSRFKENKFGMRWRLEKEVISGKGQFTCGNVRCTAGADARLRSWEVNFAYKERGEHRNALVKLRLCRDCSDKLNYRYNQFCRVTQHYLNVLNAETPSTKNNTVCCLIISSTDDGAGRWRFGELMRVICGVAGYIISIVVVVSCKKPCTCRTMVVAATVSFTGNLGRRRDVTGQKVGSEEPAPRCEETTATDEPETKRPKPDDGNQTDFWRSTTQTQSAQSSAPKTQEEEFDEYFADMLL